MEIYYKLEIFFPDGHVEEMEEEYHTLEEAVSVGNSMLTQISYTEEYHKQNIDEDGFKKARKPYYIVSRVLEEGRQVVFDSRKK